MAQSPEEFFSQLCREAGLDETQTASALALAKHEKLAPKLAETIRRSTDDFNAMHGRVRAAETKVQGYDAWYQETAPKYSATVAELEQLKARNGNPNPNGNGAPPPNFDTSKFVAKEDVLALLNERDQRVAGAMKEVGRIASRHVAMFGEELDTDAVEKLAIENQLSITGAYERFVKPRVDERTTEATKKREQQIREEAVRDYASQHNLPAESVPSHRSFIVDRPSEAPKGGTDAELVDLYLKTGAGSSART